MIHDKKKQILIQTPKTWRDAIIPQTTFVMYCDSHHLHFNLMLGLLASIQELNYYKHVDINIVDNGMTPEQINILRGQFMIKDIKKAITYDVDLYQRHHPLMIARSEITKYFHGYRYYLSIDTDTWIQDEHILDEYLKLTIKQGISATAWQPQFKDATNYRAKCIEESLFDEKLFEKSPSYNLGVVLFSSKHI